MPFIFIAFNHDRVASWMAYIAKNKGLSQSLLVLGFSAVVLVMIWTASLGKDVKIGATVPTVIFSTCFILGVWVIRLLYIPA